ncbi:glycosyltransferase family 4 protein [Zunongwangia sp. F260]|uniref:Glycosyltransferase family 4 protein n=1 Tax=Autumnicola lenta TaxID=3075593 RepID=A0ABU3CQ41_9FLAO|nr:glycosyltransferase family 4 protein [Zunongwangia sp. F260]MDT0648469.1 glycosyltransferase family 4 protein [Zunongwangia sp. F260]
MHKLIRITTIPLSLNLLLRGQLSFLSQYYAVSAISGKGKDLEEVGIREGVRTIEIKMERGISILQDLKSFWQLYKCFRKEKPQIIHSITPKAGLLSMAAGYFARVPIRMHTFTGLIFPSKTGLLKRLLIFMDRCLCFFATNVYPEGEGVKRDLIQYEITKKPLKILANGNVNGVDISYFSPYAIPKEEKSALCHNLGIKAKDFVFVFVGRLVGDKGINELIAAFVKLDSLIEKNKTNKKDVVKLLLVGPFESQLDPLKPETLKEIQNNANILSVGFQPDVRPYFSISNVLLFPSYREGFPNVVLQAGAMGLPSIVTDINGSNEIIEEGTNGIIIPVRHTEALYKAMNEIFFNKNFRYTLGENSRQVIKDRYERTKIWEALLAEYKHLEAGLHKNV